MGQMTRSRYGSLLLAALCAGCGGGSSGGDPGAAPAGPAQAAAPAVPAAGTAPGRQVAGGASFSLDGGPLHFEALPEGHNYYTSMASQVTVRPRVDATEQLSITFASMDLRQLQYPAELPGPRQAGTLLDPLAAMAGVGFSYRTEDGREWAGPGRVRIEQFGRDGVIVGSFTGVTLPHTDRQLPDISLSDGTFRARISAPW